MGGSCMHVEVGVGAKLIGYNKTSIYGIQFVMVLLLNEVIAYTLCHTQLLLLSQRTHMDDARPNCANLRF